LNIIDNLVEQFDKTVYNWIIQVEERARKAVDERKKLTEAFNSGIGADGLKLSLSISKT